MYYNEKRIKALIKTKAFYKNYTKKDVDKQRLMYLLNKFGKLFSSEVTRFAILFSYCEDDELIKLFEYYLNNKSNKWGNTKEEFIQRYGFKEGNIRYSKVSLLRSENAKKGAFTIKYWQDKGYTLCAAKERIREIAIKGQIDRDYSNRVKTKIELSFWTNKGYTLEDAIILRKPYLKAISKSLDDLIERHGVEKGTKLREDETNKRIATIIKKYGSMSFCCGQKGKASKASLKVFNPIIEGLKNKNFNIFIGKEGSKEYWVRDKDNNKKYYFIDFYIKELNLAIEYNGVQWHPKSKESFNKYGVLKEKYEELLKKDIQKELSIRNTGIKLLIIWGDDTIEHNINKSMEFINERINKNKQ